MTAAPRHDPLFDPVRVGAMQLPHRVIMAPLTRSRTTQPGDVPNDLMATYYRQRASAGLIISEAAQISPQGKGYAFTPGIYTADQVHGWQQITQSVRDGGGRIFLQLWHVGRIGHVALQPDGQAPVAPSAVPARSQVYIDKESGLVPVSEPRALALDELPGIIDQYRKAAERAQQAGFDGVEIHGANGYLLDQFTRDGTNHRTDDYGGSVENRTRLPVQVAEAVAAVWGPDRVGYRVAPHGTFNDMSDSDPPGTFGFLAEKLGQLGIAYIHAVEEFGEQPRTEDGLQAVRSAFSGVYMANGGYSAELARQRIAGGQADVVSFGRLFIANPDLPARFERGAALNDCDSTTFYGGDRRGYTDYPAMSGAG